MKMMNHWKKLFFLRPKHDQRQIHTGFHIPKIKVRFYTNVRSVAVAKPALVLYASHLPTSVFFLPCSAGAPKNGSINESCFERRYYYVILWSITTLTSSPTYYRFVVLRHASACIAEQAELRRQQSPTDSRGDEQDEQRCYTFVTGKGWVLYVG